jgi:hypothetical protein
MEELPKLKCNINRYLNFELEYDELHQLHNLRYDQCFHYYVKGRNKGTWCNNIRLINDNMISCKKHLKTK